MDKEQDEIQFLSFLDIFRESFNIISTCRKIFTQITLAIILPLSFIFLAHIEISDYLFAEILSNEYELDYTQQGTYSYTKLSDVISSEWTSFWLFKVAYFIFFLVLSLLSTSAIVYTIACVYTAKELTFKKVMSVVPRVWKRLMITFIWNFIIVFAFNVFALLELILWVVLVGPSMIGIVILSFIFISYLIAFVYVSVVWHLASVISVLEDVYGIQALIKSNSLIKGKTTVSVAIFLLLNLCFLGIQIGFERQVVGGIFNRSLGFRIMSGLVYLVLLSILTLFGLILQTIIYFICKSYHHENIDKSLLSDHLEVYLGDYVPLMSKDVQLESFHV